MKYLVVAIALTFILAAPAGAQKRVYACKNDKGSIELTDRPCDAASTHEQLRGAPPPRTSAGQCNAARAALRLKDTPANRAAMHKACDVP
ncbi:MAG TPA: DUF4124 domain-containing protein [Ramlibacter sp.]|nr:DUF4124 domain-containing protein [Ramlibacter sp.]